MSRPVILGLIRSRWSPHPLPRRRNGRRGKKHGDSDLLMGFHDQGPVETLPPIPSLPGLFVLLRGGLLLPGLPVALGAIRSSSSSTLSRISSFIVFHLLPILE